MYHPIVIDHFDNPRNVGSFNKNDPNVGTEFVGAPACGDLMKLQVKFDGSGKIVDARFKTFGWGSAIAASSLGMFNLYEKLWMDFSSSNCVIRDIIHILVDVLFHI